MKYNTALSIRWLFVQRAVAFLLFLIAASWRISDSAAVFFSIYGISTLLFGLLLNLRRSNAPDVEKPTISTRSGKLIDQIAWILSTFVIHTVAGIVSASLPCSTILLWLGGIVYGISSLLVLYAIFQNPALSLLSPFSMGKSPSDGEESASRNAIDAGIFLWCVAEGLFFPHIAVICFAVVIAVLTIVQRLCDKRRRPPCNG